jgi:hypothetical protein
MAVGTVSGVDNDVWQLIATNTPSAATTTTFSSISGYKKLMITFQVTLSTADRMYVQFNGDSTANNYGMATALYANNNGARSSDRFNLMAFADGTANGYMVIADTDKTTPKWIERMGGNGTTGGNGLYFGTSAVSSASIATDNGYTITGTIKLYGIAA